MIDRFGRSGVEGRVSGSRLIKFKNDIVADGIYKRPKPLGVLQAFLLSENLQHSQKSLLPNVINLIGGPPTAPKLDAQKLTEVDSKMLLDGSVTFREATHVLSVKILLFHD